MKLLIISQHLAMEDPGQDNLFQLAKAHTDEGQQATVITARKPGYADTGKREKKILMEMKDGVLMLHLNIPYEHEMGLMAKLNVFYRYARQVRKVGRSIPKPDVIIAASPPPTVSLAAAYLSRRFKVPLVLNISELYSDNLARKGGITVSIVAKITGLMDRLAYARASIITAGSESVYSVMEERYGPAKKVTLIEDSLIGKSKIYNSYRMLLDSLHKKR